MESERRLEVLTRLSVDGGDKKIGSADFTRASEMDTSGTSQL